MVLKWFVGLAVLVLASACAHDPGPLGGAPDLQVLDTTILPPPPVAGPDGEVAEFHIGPFDKLMIDVFGVEDLAREVQVDGSGRITFPLVGVLHASGTNTGELARTIEDRLRGTYVRDPHVTVNLKETVSHNLTVEGQVREPGQYPVIGTMTLIEAIAAAGGTTEFSDLDEVVVFRSIGNQRYAALYNLAAIRRGNYVDPRLYASDIIVVGDSPGRRLFKDLLSASSLLATPIVALINTLPRN